MNAMAPQVPFQVPAHIPSKLFWDADLAEFVSNFDDPFVGISALYEGPELIYARSIDRGQPGWIPTRYDVIKELFMDSARFSSKENIGIGQIMGVDWRLNPLEIDPPDHMAYRQVLQPYFQPSAVTRYESSIRSIAQQLIVTFEERKRCEFIEEFASLFPSYVFLDLVGLPRAMLPQFLEWEHQFTRALDPETRVGAARSILHYLEAYVERRRNDERDDLVSGILNAKINGRPLNHGEIMGMIMVLYFGGLDTVVSSLGWYLRHLATHPELQERLRKNPADVPGAVDDLLRAYGVVLTKRTVVDDIEFRGVFMRKGDVVLMPGFLASRDERQFPNPHTVDPDRKGRSLTLATGVHTCLGAHLAKREIKIVLEEFLGRFRNIRVPPGSPQSWKAVGGWAITRLSLEWD
jgi:cytochrome P450